MVILLQDGKPTPPGGGDRASFFFFLANPNLQNDGFMETIYPFYDICSHNGFFIGGELPIWVFIRSNEENEENDIFVMGF